MTDIKKRIMRRIYLIWFFRQALNPLSLKVFVIGALAWQFTSYVSIKNVIMNWPLRGDLIAHYKFIESAFLSTEFVTLVLTLGILAVGAWLVKDALLGKGFLNTGKAFVRI